MTSRAAERISSQGLSAVNMALAVAAPRAARNASGRQQANDPMTLNIAAIGRAITLLFSSCRRESPMVIPIPFFPVFANWQTIAGRERHTTSLNRWPVLPLRREPLPQGTHCTKAQDLDCFPHCIRLLWGPPPSRPRFDEHRRAFPTGIGDGVEVRFHLATPNNFARLAGSKPHDRLVSYDRDRRGHESPPLKFVQGPFVADHVALLKYNPVLQKKLFRTLAKRSARLAKDENLSSHMVSSLEIGNVQSKPLACRTISSHVARW